MKTATKPHTRESFLISHLPFCSTITVPAVRVPSKVCTDTMAAVFGDKPVAPSEMTKKLWSYIKKKNLASR